MLVLSRRIGEEVVIGDNIVVTIVDVRGDMVRLGIDAPREIAVNRAEVREAVAQANLASITTGDEGLDALKRLRPAAKKRTPGPQP